MLVSHCSGLPAAAPDAGQSVGRLGGDAPLPGGVGLEGGRKAKAAVHAQIQEVGDVVVQAVDVEAEAAGSGR